MNSVDLQSSRTLIVNISLNVLHIMEPGQASMQNEALRKNFSNKNFILSSAGLLKLFGIILFIVGSIISLSAEVCSDYMQWLELVFPIITVFNGALLTILYISILLGLAKKIPTIWVKIDITCCTLTAIVTLVLSILVLANCSSGGALSIIPGIFGIVGSLMLFITSATLFVTWQNTEENVNTAPAPVRETIDPKRKSIFV